MVDEAYAEEGEKPDYYSGNTKIKGGASSTDQATGYVMVTPKGYNYCIKVVSTSGREKGTFVDPSSKQSKDLDDA